MESWSFVFLMSDKLAKWLDELGLSQYAKQFSAQEVVFADLAELNDEDLKEIGIPLGPRKRILKGAAALEKVESPEVSVGANVFESDDRPATWERHPDERKQATVLFADITDSTSLTEHLDAEDTHDLLDGVRRRICRAVADNRGTVCRVTGDGVMALFGVPVASEHHALEACEAALAMQQAVHDYSAESETRHGCVLKIRVGLHSGEIVVLTGGEGGNVEYDADGPTVPIAARMEQAATPGSVYITDATKSLAENRIEVEVLAPVLVKGISEPVPAFSLCRVRSIDELPIYNVRTHFVGRRSELNQFKGMLDTCIEDGHGQTIYVRGEPGIGKTRLVEEFTKIADVQGVLSLRGLVLPFGVGMGQDAIRALVRGLLKIPPGCDTSDRQRAAETAISSGRLESEHAVFLNDLLDLPQPIELRILYDAMDNDRRNAGKQKVVSALVIAISSTQPVLVIVEDVHWAGGLTLAHLSTLAKTVAECPAMLVMTSRIEGDQLDQNWRSSTVGSPFISIDLGPLREQEAIALIGEFIDTSDALAESFLERAAGNPLFLEQMLRNVKEGTSESLPDSIQSLVLARVDRLTPYDKKALQAASVIGQRFDAEIISDLLDSDNYECRELLTHNLVRPEGSGYLFTHALIQESVYNSLVKSQRRELHRKVAQWFGDSDLVLFAEHLARAGDEGAPKAFLAAAQQEASRYRYDRAATLVNRGLELTNEENRFSLQCFQADLLRLLSLPHESIAVYRAAKEAATSDIDRCRASVGVAEGLRIIEAHHELLEELKIAETIGRKYELSLELARVNQLKGGVHFLLGETDACVKAHHTAVGYADEAGLLEVKAQTLSGLGDAEYARGRMISAFDYFDRCIEISREQGLGKTLAANLVMRGVVSRWKNDRQAAIRDFEEALSLAEETGQTRAEMITLHAGEQLAEWGELDKGEFWLQRRLELARRLGARTFEGETLSYLGRIAYMRDRWDEAEKLVEEAITILREGGMAFAGGEALGLLALVTNNSNRRAEALSEAEEVLSKRSVSHNYLHFYRDAMEVCLRMEIWDEVDRYAQALEDYTKAEPLPLPEFCIARGRALAAFGRGSRDDSTIQELHRLCDEAERVGLKVAVPAIEQALSLSEAL